MLHRAVEFWRARGKYRDMLRPLTARERVTWVSYAATARARGKRIDRPDEFTFHARRQLETQHSRPVAPSARSIRLTPSNLSDTAIVMQGPLVLASDFTFHSARFYRESFPDAPLVVVVWSSESTQDLQELRSLGAHVVVLDLPNDPGPANINLQRSSVLAGLHAAENLGCQFAVRTRSDQRFYDDQALPFLHATLDAFRPPSSGPYSRIVTTSLDTFRFRLYGLSDQFHFGRVSDLLQFWQAEEDVPKDQEASSSRALQAARLNLPEVALTSAYLDRTGWELKWSLSDWWQALADRFVIVDASALDLVWPKYSSREFRWRRYGDASPLEEVDFADWLSLYVNSEQQLGSDYDYLLDRDDWWDYGL